MTTLSKPTDTNETPQHKAGAIRRRDAYLARRAAAREKFLTQQKHRQSKNPAASPAQKLTLSHTLKMVLLNSRQMIVLTLLAFVTLPIWPIILVLLLVTRTRHYLSKSLRQVAPHSHHTLMLIIGTLPLSQLKNLLPLESSRQLRGITGPEQIYDPSGGIGSAQFSPFTRYQLNRLSGRSPKPHHVSEPDRYRSLVSIETTCLSSAMHGSDFTYRA